MNQKILLTLGWFPAVLLIIFFNLRFLYASQSAVEPDSGQDFALEVRLPEKTFMQVAGAGAESPAILGAEIVSEDARILLIRNFLMRHDSPMAPYAEHFITEADENGIDFRLAAAIAMCESNLGKKMPKDSHNAWGIAVYTGEQSGSTFTDWPQAIAWVSTYIKERYYDKGLIDLKDIGAVYAPPSVDTDYSWTRCVEKFQNSIN